MAKTEISIYLDYQKALRQADQLEEAAKKLKKEKTNLHSCRGGITSAWKGESATVFVKKIGVVEDDLDRIAKSIQRTADVIRRIAKETYQAEQRALELAKVRKV